MSPTYRMLEILAPLVSLHNPDCWNEIEKLYTPAYLSLYTTYILYLLKDVLIPVQNPPPTLFCSFVRVQEWQTHWHMGVSSNI